MSTADFTAWGWRLPFAGLADPAAVVAVYIRLKLQREPGLPAHES